MEAITIDKDRLAVAFRMAKKHVQVAVLTLLEATNPYHASITNVSDSGDDKKEEVSEPIFKGYRHGDVILVKGKIPSDAMSVPARPLALGEVTGHSHQITEGDFELYEKGGVLYCRIDSEKAALTHEEHAKIELPKGDYEIKIQREYTPEGWNNVRD